MNVFNGQLLAEQLINQFMVVIENRHYSREFEKTETKNLNKTIVVLFNGRMSVHFNVFKYQHGKRSEAQLDLFLIMQVHLNIR